MRARFLLFAACLLPVSLTAQEPGPEPATEALGGEESEPIRKVDSAKVDEWIEQLESNRFAIRNRAMQELQRSGLAVIDEVEAIASSGSTEAADRAFEVLKRHHQSSDNALQIAAKEKLKRIAETPDHPKAKQAAEVLDPAPKNSANRPNFRPFPNILPGNMQIQIQQQMRAGNGKTTRVRIVNGKKDVTVEENGTKIQVTEDANGIKVERTDAKGKKEKKQYKDLDELKKKDPEARKVFDEAGVAGNRIQLQIRGRQLGGIPNVPGAPRANGVPIDVQKRIEAMRAEQQKRIEDMRKRRDEAQQKMKERREQQTPPTTPNETPPKPIEIKAPEVVEV